MLDNLIEKCKMYKRIVDDIVAGNAPIEERLVSAELYMEDIHKLYDVVFYGYELINEKDKWYDAKLSMWDVTKDIADVYNNANDNYVQHLFQPLKGTFKTVDGLIEQLDETMRDFARDLDEASGLLEYMINDLNQFMKRNKN